MCNCSHSHCGANIHGHEENKKQMDSEKGTPARKDVVAKLTEAYAPIVREVMDSFSKALVEKMGKGEIPAVEIGESENGDTIIRVFSVK